MTKQCSGHCQTELPLGEFPPNKQYGQRRHPYCRKCCREKVAEHRATLKRIAALRRKADVIWRQTDAERVIYAIRKGKQTQPQIALFARLKGDELGDVLARLIIEEGRVKSQIVNGQRRYFERKKAA